MKEFYIYHSELIFGNNNVHYKVDPLNKRCWHMSKDIKTLPQEFEEIPYDPDIFDDLCQDKVSDMIQKILDGLERKKMTRFHLENSSLKNKEDALNNLNKVVQKRMEELDFYEGILRQLS